MFWFAETAEAAHGAAEHAEEAEHHSPIIVDLVNHYFGEYAYRFEMAYTKPFWTSFLGFFGTTPEDAFGPYTPENAIPWYTVMFVIACILSVVIIWILKGKLSESEPGHGQQTLEVSVLAVRDGELKPLPFGETLESDTKLWAPEIYWQDIWRPNSGRRKSIGKTFGASSRR